MKSIPCAAAAVKPISYQVEATAAGLTAYGGAGLLAGFFATLHLPDLLAALPGLPPTRRYPPVRFLLALLYGLILDRSRQAHVAELGTDPTFLRLSGLEALPSQSALSRFLSHLRAPAAAGVLALNRSLVARVRQGFRRFPVLTLDFDSHVQTCRGRPQRAAVGYNPRRRGARSYHPLFAFLGETRDFVGGVFRGGKAVDLRGAKGLLMDLRRWLRRVGFRGRLQFRGDSGFYAGWFLDLLEEQRFAYAVTADVGYLARCLVGLPWRPLDSEYAVAEFVHRALSWKHPRRMIAVRRRLHAHESVRSKQLKLVELEGYTYHVIVTNLRLPPEEVWRFYNGRANLENLIKEGRLGLSMDEVCSHTYPANALHNWLALLAGNLLAWLGEGLELTRREGVAALREKLLRIPARLVHTGRRWTLKLSRHAPYAPLFARAHTWVTAGAAFP